MSGKKNKKNLDELSDSEDIDNSSKNKKQIKRKILKNIVGSESESESGSELDAISSVSNNSSTSSDSDDDKNSSLQKKLDISKKKPTKNSNEIFKELIKKQLLDVPSQWKLNINDMKRICKYIDTSIFDNKNCCIWNGYITNMNNSNKGTYVNFYFRNKKVALHRLLYSNFVAPLDSSEYLKFNCDNKGICCNINHYEKYKYSKNNNLAKKEHKYKEPKKEIKEITIVGPDEPEKLIIDFD
jgi:hypothetical protein